MHVRAPALICSILPHGEAGAVVRVLTRDHGLIAGYVRGGRGRANRPILMAGNIVVAELRARVESQLPSLSAELVHSRAPMLQEPLAAASVEWVCGLLAVALPERQSFPRIYDAVTGLLDAIEAAPAARGWIAALVQFERLLLAELGYALALDVCVASGATENLAWVSPRRAAAVSAAAAQGHEARLLRLPAFLRGHKGTPEPGDLIDGLALTGYFLEHNILAQHRSPIFAARERLTDRLKNMFA